MNRMHGIMAMGTSLHRIILWIKIVRTALTAEKGSTASLHSFGADSEKEPRKRKTMIK
jgi:hypothetical protein